MSMLSNERGTWAKAYTGEVPGHLAGDVASDAIGSSQTRDVHGTKAEDNEGH